MILDKLRTSANKAYDSLAGLSLEAEPLVFYSLYPLAHVRSRLPATLDADTELYLHLTAALFLGLGYLFSSGHYLFGSKKSATSAATNALKGVISTAEFAASKAQGTITGAVRNVKDITDKLR